MTRKEKLNTLVTKNPVDSLAKNRERISNRAMLKESQAIALKVLDAMDDRGLSQKGLAELMSVSPQYINKMIRGKENLTLNTIVKLQEVLGIEILVTRKQNSWIKGDVSKYYSSMVFYSLNESITKKRQAYMQELNSLEPVKIIIGNSHGNISHRCNYNTKVQSVKQNQIVELWGQAETV